MLVSMWGENNYMCFLQNTFNFSYQWVDIMLTKDDICVLVDVVMVDPTQANLLPQSYTTQGFVASDAVQAKEQSYLN